MLPFESLTRKYYDHRAFYVKSQHQDVPDKEGLADEHGDLGHAGDVGFEILNSKLHGD